MIMNLVKIGGLRDRVLSGFFVAEGNLSLLMQDIPQTVTEMYACAKRVECGASRVARVANDRCLPIPHRQNTFRGALTNGLEWVFIILYLNDNGNGATYKYSNSVKINVVSEPFGPERIKGHAPDVIAGILSYWVGPVPS